MMTQPLPKAGKFPIKTLVARNNYCYWQNVITAKGGIDGPAGPANAGALPGALRNAGPLLPL